MKYGCMFTIELFITIFIMAVICVCLFYGTIKSANYARERKCVATATKQGLTYDYSFWSGCMVKIDGKWIDYSKYRKIE